MNEYIRELELGIINLLESAKLPTEVKRLVIADVHGIYDKKADEEVMRERIAKKNTAQKDNETEVAEND